MEVGESKPAQIVEGKRVESKSVELLIVVCDPTKSPLPAAEIEADAVSAVAKRCGKRVEVRYHCDAEQLRKLLADEVRPRMLLFIGHADATDPYTRELTLGLTDEAGNVKLLDPETIADVLGHALDQLRGKDHSR